MNITPETSLADLLKEYPKLNEFLPTLSPAYKNLKNPVRRRKRLGKATLVMMAERGPLEVEDLIEAIQVEINSKIKNDVKMEPPKSITKDLNAGIDTEVLRDRLAEHVRDVTPTEIFRLEQSLIDEGLPEEEAKRQCDVHEKAKYSLDQQDKPRALSDPPVHNSMAENRAAENTLSEIEGILEECAHHSKMISTHSNELKRLIKKLTEM
jgi:hypothetical protein